MKKIFLTIILLLLIQPVFSEDLATDVSVETKKPLIANVQFDWPDISQTERDAIILKYETELFGDNTVYKYNKKTFRNEYKNYLKDPDYKRHLMLVSNNVIETDDENLCAFRRGRLVVSYAVQYKKDLKTVYYYDMLGNLKYVDMFSENYPNFPYMSKQYRATGKLISAIYFISHDLQYMYKSDLTFRGIWYKDKMYNAKAKEILTRTNW